MRTYHIYLLLILLAVLPSCENCEMTIDSYEVHTNIDIPKVTRAECYYEDENGVKITIFDLNERLVDIPAWASRYEFKRMDSTYQPHLEGLGMLAEADQHFPAYPHLLRRFGEDEEREWEYFMDKRDGKIWAEIRRK
ncbi:MAG: hypothetical protein AAFR61_06260 [Bacteroidota bacterium]